MRSTKTVQSVLGTFGQLHACFRFTCRQNLSCILSQGFACTAIKQNKLSYNCFCVIHFIIFYFTHTCECRSSYSCSTSKCWNVPQLVEDVRRRRHWCHASWRWATPVHHSTIPPQSLTTTQTTITTWLLYVDLVWLFRWIESDAIDVQTCVADDLHVTWHASFSDWHMTSWRAQTAANAQTHAMHNTHWALTASPFSNLLYRVGQKVTPC